MNKEYMKPAMRVVKLQHQCHILSGSPVNSIGGNAELDYGGGGSGSARARSHGVWNDEED